MPELAPFPSLDSLSPRARERIASERAPFDFAPRTTVIRAGQTVDGTFFVDAGALRVFGQDTEGREKTLYHVRPGQSCILAVNAAFTGLTYPATVAAGESGAAGFVLRPAVYRELFETEPAVRDFTVHVLTQWIYELMTSVESVALQPIDQQLARTLVRRADAGGAVTGTHQDLAADLGTAREVVSRHLRRFEEAGWVRLGRGSLTILDPAALARASS